MKQPKKKVYVETTVISDATALPTNDLDMMYDETLEEVWRIKREIAAEYPTLEDYFKEMMDYQDELKRQGVEFVQLPPREPESAMAMA